MLQMDGVATRKLRARRSRILRARKESARTPKLRASTLSFPGEGIRWEFAYPEILLIGINIAPAYYRDVESAERDVRVEIQKCTGPKYLERIFTDVAD